SRLVDSLDRHRDDKTLRGELRHDRADLRVADVRPAAGTEVIGQPSRSRDSEGSHRVEQELAPRVLDGDGVAFPEIRRDAVGEVEVACEAGIPLVDEQLPVHPEVAEDTSFWLVAPPRPRLRPRGLRRSLEVA